MNKSASIIIPTLNEQNYLPRILGDLAENKFDATAVEIIVSDSGSSDRTAQVAAEFAERYAQFNFKFVPAPQRGVSNARNNGANHAEGNYLFFLDADTRIPANFIPDSLAEMENRKLDAAGCYAYPDSTKLLDHLSVWLVNQHGSIAQYGSRPLVVGAGMMASREIHHALGGFDQSIRFGEDLDYARRATRLGLFRMLNSTRIIYSMRRIEAEGRFNTTLKGLIGQLYYQFGDLHNIKFQYDFGKLGTGKKDQPKQLPLPPDQG